MRAFIEDALQTAFPEATLRITDTTGGGDHFDVEVVTPRFAGLSMIDQHRMVYDALGEKLGYEIHALALRTRTPAP